MSETIAVSGGFDPLNAAHLNLFTNASARGELIVILNSDDWLYRKKGYWHMPWAQRAALIRGLRMVARVETVADGDDTVCEALVRLAYHDKLTYFANGGDRGAANIPSAELNVCKTYGITPLFNMTDKEFVETHSSAIVARGWGHYAVLDARHDYKVKRLELLPGCATSRQRHKFRDERFFVVSGTGHLVVGNATRALIGRGVAMDYTVPRETWHQVVNTGHQPLVLIEVQTGISFQEEDIERAATT